MPRILALPFLAALLVTAAPLCGQRPSREPADARKIQRLESELAQAGAARDEALQDLRATYRRLEKHLDGIAPRTAEILHAEVARVLESPLAAARAANGPRASQKRKARNRLERELEGVGERLEKPPLDLLGPWVGQRVLAVVDEGDDIDAALELPREDLARRALEPALDASRPFHVRWNRHFADALPAARRYAQAVENLEDARNELMVARDPLLAFTVDAPVGFARIPAGTYQILNTTGFAGMGSRQWPSRAVRFDEPFFIGLREVTNGEYLEWLDTLGSGARDEHLPRDAAGKPLWTGNLEAGVPKPVKAVRDHPVRGIRLRSAALYADWRGARLPTEAEWCAMAGGPGKARDIPQYPWGDAWRPDHCNSAELEFGGPMEVGSFPNGRGPFGHYDVAGNVSEWLMTDFDTGKTLTLDDLADKNAVVRGGSYKGGQAEVSVGWIWYRRAAFDKDETTGFRLARDVAPEK